MRHLLLFPVALPVVLLAGCTFLASEVVREVPVVGNTIADRIANKRSEPDGDGAHKPHEQPSQVPEPDDAPLRQAQAKIAELYDRIDDVESGSVPLGNCGQIQRDSKGRTFAKCYLSVEKAREIR